jgi:hypothetical protein
MGSEFLKKLLEGVDTRTGINVTLCFSLRYAYGYNVTNNVTVLFC